MNAIYLITAIQRTPDYPKHSPLVTDTMPTSVLDAITVEDTPLGRLILWIPFNLTKFYLTRWHIVVFAQPQLLYVCTFLLYY